MVEKADAAVEPRLLGGADVTDMRGKTCVVTGATAGIGLEVARQLAARGATVIGVGRDPERCARAAETVQRAAEGGSTRYEVADLSSLAEVTRLAARIAPGTRAVDVLVNNAGLFAWRRRESTDGIELQLAVNYLAPFLLTGLLLPLLRAAGRARVVVTSSGSHYAGRMHWDDLGLRRWYSGLKAYGQSKLATVLFVRELARRLGPGASVDAYAADPGLVNTEIALKGSGPIVRLVWKARSSRGIPASEAAASIVHLCADPGVEGRTGLYWKEREPREPSLRARDGAEARRLWEESERLCGFGYAL